MNQNLKHMMRANLYRLKRQYGGRITIHKKGTALTDPKTGRKRIISTQYRVRRAIVLPVETSREEVRGISVISANKGLVQGGWYDNSLTYFIVEQHDVPGVLLTPDDWIVHDSKKFQIVEYREFPFSTCWIITAKALLGEVPPQSIDVTAETDITVTQSAETEA